MTATRAELRPRYTGDEIVLGVIAALALHAAALGPLVYKAVRPPSPDAEDETPFVARPVVQATLLKLGKPIDKNKLPDRFVPKARTAPKKQLIASREDPIKTHDAGAPPPPNTQDSDLQNLIAKSDPFAEDGGITRPEEGHPGGVDGGTETDPTKVRAGDMYATLLGTFFHERWTIPTVISQGQANNMCVVFQVAVSRNMVIWHVKQAPVRPSGNELFDDSARAMLQKLLEDHAPLPQPPAEVEELFRGRTVQIALSGNPRGDSSRCK